MELVLHSIDNYAFLHLNFIFQKRRMIEKLPVLVVNELLALPEFLYFYLAWGESPNSSSNICWFDLAKFFQRQAWPVIYFGINLVTSIVLIYLSFIVYIILLAPRESLGTMVSLLPLGVGSGSEYKYPSQTCSGTSFLSIGKDKKNKAPLTLIGFFGSFIWILYYICNLFFQMFMGNVFWNWRFAH